MKVPQEALLAYLATLVAIVVLTVTAAIVVATGDLNSPEGIAKIIGALSFIGAAVTGLVGVIGTFRPRGRGEPAEGE